MVAHFNISGSNNSFYFTISTIRHDVSGLFVSGTIGDGSAETLFEAQVGEILRVQVLPIWEADSEALCQRYDQAQLEQALSESLEDVSFRSEGTFDRETGNWLQHFVAVPKSSSGIYCQTARLSRPHQNVCESGPVWQQALADSGS